MFHQAPATTSQAEVRSRFRAVLDRMRLGPHGAKIAVVASATVCWLVVLLVRTAATAVSTTLEGASLTALAALLQQGSISGRDVQSLYGPGAQVLAWAAAAASSAASAFSAYALIAFLFSVATAGIVAASLFLCDRLSWQQVAVFYGFAFSLNLFFGALDIAVALLLLNAVLAYRIVAAETLTQMTLWAVATGVVCFCSQLVTFQTGVYATVAVFGAAVVGSILIRNLAGIVGALVFIATMAIANVALAVFFKVSGSQYALLFDYQNYSLEMLRAHHISMGTGWELPLTHTVILLVVSLYAIAMSIVAIRKSDRLDAVVFVSMAIAALLWMRTAFMRGDLSHIAIAFAPVAVLLSFLARPEWRSPKRRFAWVIAAAGLFMVWPAFSVEVPRNLFSVVSGETSLPSVIRRLYVGTRELDASVASVVTADFAEQRDVPLLAFPHDSYVVAGLGRPMFAPILESYAATTPILQRRYVDELQQRSNFEVLYDPNDNSPGLDNRVQSITRNATVFEYLYRRFELSGIPNAPGAHQILRPMYPLRDIRLEALAYGVSQQSADSGTMKLRAPSTCGLIRLEMRVDYAKSLSIFSPSGIDVSLSNGDAVVWQGSIMPPDAGIPFVTYVSPLPMQTFHRVFLRDAIAGVRWDKLQYQSLPAGLLGSKAKLIELRSLACVDPARFAEAVPAA